jgi:hypothetical protein
MAEALRRQLEQAILSRRILGIKITQGEKRINHSQFAYD